MLMRRAAMAAMTAGLVLGVGAVASPGPEASGQEAGPAAPNGGESRAATPMKTVPMKRVAFAGYFFDVPANWPVYRLGTRPHQCVRYDEHAVYLGSPGPDQQCPAHLVGRTETIRIERAARAASAPRGSRVVSSGGSGVVGGLSRQAGAVASGQAGAVASGQAGAVASGQAGAVASGQAGAVVSGQAGAVASGQAGAVASGQAGAVVSGQAGAVADGQAGAVAGGAAVVAGGAAGARNVPGVLVRNAARRELGMTLRGPGLSIVATYGTKPSVAERIIASLRSAGSPATATPDRTRLTGKSPRARGSAAEIQAGSGHVAGEAVAAPARSASFGGPLPGFDTCTAPSLAAMQAWRSAYSVVGIYIGGLNRACDQGNLSVRWVSQVRALGWLLIPTYVGLQPPCDHFSAKIDPKNAVAEARGAANSAVAHALALGLRRGAPIYFDMEGYNSKRSRCRDAVLTFLDAWTRQLHARHFVSGVYSSVGSGVEDLGNTGSVAGHMLAEPDSIWFALWDGHGNLQGSPYMLPSWWPQHRRIKQFRGGRWQRHGKFRLNIDRDWVFGAVY
jgi:Rv2525c-like, glycoside hydrolase-like domain